jgi:proteasome lid subunit RPN8/RPN11
MKSPVRLARAVLDDIVAHAVAEAPRECCGLLAGTPGHVDESVRTANLSPGNSRYLVDPAEHFALLKRLRGTARDVVGAYHSHPRSEAVPSPTDLAEAFSEAFVYVIVSLRDAARPDVRAYRLVEGRACELELVEG